MSDTFISKFSYLPSFQHSMKGNTLLCMLDEKDYKQFDEKLKRMGYAFSVRRSTIFKESSILFEHKHGNLPIRFFGFPFMKTYICTYTCAQGPKYFKLKRERCLGLSSSKSDLQRSRTSKKVECPAEMRILKIHYYPDYMVKSNNRVNKKQIIQKLKRDLSLDSVKVPYKEKYYVSVSLPEVHTHGLNITRHSNVPIKDSDKMDDLNLNDSFLKTVYVCQKGRIDQENLAEKIITWKRSQESAGFYFRGFSDDNDQSLLLCYQTMWQQKMLSRYSSVCFLVATYKLINFDLPLYTLIVKTNVGYCSVGVFVVQVDSKEALQEALEVFKDWNPGWSPEVVLTDICLEEINAVTASLNCQVHICAFNRRKAWRTRLQGSMHPEELFRLWENLAQVKNTTELPGNIQALQESTSWSNNAAASAYFNETWLPHSRLWVEGFVNPNILNLLDMNNGMETLKTLLENSPLKNLSDETLPNIMTFIVDQYFPSLWEEYQNDNILLHTAKLPEFLHQRPQFLVSHIYKRYISGLKYSLSSIKRYENNMFAIRSESFDTWYIVDFSAPSCSCPDFTKWRFPCKHICAVFIFTPGYSFLDLPETYRNSPYLTLDNEDDDVDDDEDITDDFYDVAVRKMRMKIRDLANSVVLKTSRSADFAKLENTIALLEQLNNIDNPEVMVIHPVEVVLPDENQTYILNHEET